MANIASNKCKIEISDPLLVSCPNTGGLVYIHGNSHLVITYSDVTGVSDYGEAFIWVLQDNGARSLQRVVNGGIETIELDPEYIDLHDVLVSEENIFAVHTKTNQVVRYNTNFEEMERWGLEGAQDSSHINCIAIYKDKLIASIFGRFHEFREYKNGTKELGEVIDVVSNKVLIRGLSQPHSLLVKDELLYLCNSEANELCVYKDKTLETRIKLPGYTRGLAISDDFIYVGLSKSRNVNGASKQMGAGIAIVRRDDLFLEGVMAVPFSEIYEIKLVGNKFSAILKMLLAYQNEDGELSSIKKERLAERDAYDRLMKDYEQSNNAFKHTQSAYHDKCEEIKQYKLRFGRFDELEKKIQASIVLRVIERML